MVKNNEIGMEYAISANMKQLREQKKPYLSQRRLAQLLGISRSTYANYESGRRYPPAWVIVKLADYFGVSVDSIVCEEKGGKLF